MLIFNASFVAAKINMKTNGHKIALINSLDQNPIKKTPPDISRYRSIPGGRLLLVMV